MECLTMVSKGLQTLINIRNSIDLGQKVHLINTSNRPVTSCSFFFKNRSWSWISVDVVRTSRNHSQMFVFVNFRHCLRKHSGANMAAYMYTMCDCPLTCTQCVIRARRLLHVFAATYTNILCQEACYVLGTCSKITRYARWVLFL